MRTLSIVLVALLAPKLVSSELAHEGRDEVMAVLKLFEDAFWYAHEIEIIDDDGNVEGILQADSVVPMAELEIIAPEEYAGRVVKIVFNVESKKMKKALRLVKKGQAVGQAEISVYSFSLPSDFLPGDFGSVEMMHVEDFARAHNESVHSTPSSRSAPSASE